MGSEFLWTFYFKDAAKILNQSEEDEPFASVVAPTYDKAIKKVLKLKIPYVDSAESLRFGGVSEEYPADDEEIKVGE